MEEADKAKEMELHHGTKVASRIAKAKQLLDSEFMANVELQSMQATTLDQEAPV